MHTRLSTSLCLLTLLGCSFQALAQDSGCTDDPALLHCSTFTDFPPEPKMIQWVITVVHPDFEDPFETTIVDCVEGDYFIPIYDQPTMPAHTETYSWSILNSKKQFEAIEKYTVHFTLNNNGQVKANPARKYIDMSAYDDYPTCDLSRPEISEIIRLMD